MPHARSMFRSQTTLQDPVVRRWFPVTPEEATVNKSGAQLEGKKVWIVAIDLTSSSCGVVRDNPHHTSKQPETWFTLRDLNVDDQDYIESEFERRRKESISPNS